MRRFVHSWVAGGCRQMVGNNSLTEFQDGLSSILPMWSQRIAATQCRNFSAGVLYCKIFLERSLSCLATALSLA